jgi:peroxiredoxin/outer membrane lipoprotein-sorting protein
MVTFFRNYGKIFTVSMIVVWILTGVTSLAADIPSEVEKYFQLIDNYYAGATTYQAEVHLKVHLAIGKQEKSMDQATMVFWKKPNKILAYSCGNTSGTVLVSDGAKYIKYVPTVKEYLITPPPESIQKSDPMNSGVLGQFGGISDIIAAVKPSEVLKADIVKVSLKKEVVIENTPCVQINLVKNVRNKETTIDLFMDKNKGRLMRMAFDNKALLPQGEEEGNKIFTLVEEHKNARIDEPIPDSIFNFAPPKGARKVDQFSFQKNKRLKQGESTVIFPDKRPAPEFSLKDIQDKTHNLSDYGGKCLLVYFWASFYRSCSQDFPLLSEIMRDYESKGLSLLTINNEPPGKARDFLRLYNLNLTALHDPTGDVKNNYRLGEIPALVLIDRKGMIRDIKTGALKKEELEPALTALLSE